MSTKCDTCLHQDCHIDLSPCAGCVWVGGVGKDKYEPDTGDDRKHNEDTWAAWEHEKRKQDVHNWFCDYIAVAFLRIGIELGDSGNGWPKDADGLTVIPVQVGRRIQAALSGMEHLDPESLREHPDGHVSAVMVVTVDGMPRRMAVSTREWGESP